MSAALRVFGIFAALLAFAGSAWGQALSCNPATPRTDPGTGFVPFGATEQVIARGGNAGPAWEWAVGTDTEGSQSVKGSLDWVSGKVYAWTVAYNGAGAATIEVRDQGALVLSRTWATGMDAGNTLQIQVGTNPSIGATTTIAAAVTGINGNALTGAVSQTGNNQTAEQNLFYFFPPMTAGFSATGTVSLTYDNLPTGSRVQFLARSGTIACSGGNNAPTVSIASPAANAVFNAPATIAVTANAADSDGAVTKVDFYQGATLIGTATASPYTIQWANVAAGAYSLTAVATDNSNATTTSAAVPVIVNAPPTVSLTSPAAGATFNAPATVTVSATAADTDGTIAKVDFFDGATLVGTATAAPYTVTLTNVAAGAHSYTAVATDNRNATATSAAVVITVNAPPSVTITSPAAGATFNAPATVTVTATAADADGTVTKVDFFDGATLVGTATAAPYSIALSNVAAGAHSYTAVATDNANATAASAAVAITVNAPPTVNLTSPIAGASFNAPATITVTATAADADGTVTKVDFFDGATLVGTATAAPYSVTLTNVAAGAHSYTAVATDNSNATTTSAAVAISVNAPPTVSITAPAANASFNAPATITVTAVAADSDGTVVKVDFYQGSTLIGTATASPYTIQWTNVAAGAYSLTAVATDNAGATTTSAVVAITVNALPTVNLTSPIAGASFNAPATVTLTANAADADGTIAKVDFYDGATLVGTAVAAPFTVTLTGVAAGAHSYTAIATDNSNATTTSAAVAITVNAPPTVSIAAPLANASFNAPATITVTAVAADSDGTVTKVDFYQGATLIGTATASPYTIQWANVAAGAYSLTAVATDNSNATTTSAAIAISVNAAPTVSITSPAANAVFPAPASITVTATATDSDGTIAKVDFYQGTTLIGTATASPYTVQWTNVGSGAYSLTAVATDNNGATATSAAVAITVNALPTVAITSPTAGASFNAPASITVTATASDLDGTIAKVDFFQGATLIGTATTSPYTIQWTGVGTGSYVLTAVATDNLGGTTTSTAVPITVNVARFNYFIHPDHLNTPRLVADSSGTPVWKWDQAEPFGVTVPDENPSSLGAFDLPLRLLGQYYDKETNLHYNYFRDYDASIGRYGQSDPIGLRGGINTYAYVWGNPLSGIDPFGLDMICGPGRNKVGTNPNGSVQCVDNGRGPNEKVCATAACAAGIGPLPSEMRTPAEIDLAGCKFVCGLVGPGGPIPITVKGLGKVIGMNYVCDWICKEPEKNACFP